MERSRTLLSPAISLRSKLPSTWKLLAIIFALLNLKSLPFAWHLRLLHGLLIQILTSRHRLTHFPSSPRPLFAPIITSSHSGPLECDYNLHKSNSTYFSDSDVGRLHLLIATIGKGVDRTRRELEREDRTKGLLGWGKGQRKAFGVRLGGVSANFRKEIKPFERFEVWTRILAWDRKWLYVVQHFVRPGVRPGRYLLQPWRKGRAGEKEAAASKVAGESSNGHVVAGAVGEGTSGKAQSAPAHSAIFASVIAKYVCKKGRLTIPPERVLRASELLPPKPEGEEEATPPVSMTPNTDSTSFDAVAVSAAEQLTPAGAEAMLDASMMATSVAGGEVWDWARVEKERQRGMRIAVVYSRLDALNDEFLGDGAEVLGEY